jgi:hypothetical protein
MKIYSFSAAMITFIGLVVLVLGLWGYVMPYLIADRWMEVIMAGTAINKDDSYRVAKILAHDAYRYTWIHVALGVLMILVGIYDNFRYRAVAKKSNI